MRLTVCISPQHFPSLEDPWLHSPEWYTLKNCFVHLLITFFKVFIEGKIAFSDSKHYKESSQLSLCWKQRENTYLTGYQDAVWLQFRWFRDIMNMMPLNLVGASLSHVQWSTPMKCQSLTLPTCHFQFACQRSRVPCTLDENLGSSFPLPLLLQRYSSTTCLDLDHLLAQVLDVCVWSPV